MVDQVMDPEGDEFVPPPQGAPPLGGLPPPIRGPVPQQHPDQLGSAKGSSDYMRDRMLESNDKARAFGTAEAKGYGVLDQEQGAYKGLLQTAIDRLQNTQVASSPQEQRLKSAAAMFGGPGINTGMGGGFARMANSQVDQAQAAREQEFQKQLLMTKYGLESGQISMQQAQARIQQMAVQREKEETIGSHLAQAYSAQQGANARSPVTIDMGSGQAGSNPAAVQSAGDIAGAKKAAEMRVLMGGLDQNTIDAGVSLFRRTGQIPYALARGNPMAAPIIMRGAMEQVRQEGGNPDSLVTDIQLNKADQAALNALTKQQQLTESFAKNTQNGLDLVRDVSQRTDRTGAPAVNRWLQAGQVAIKGDSDVTLLHNTINTAVADYGKVMYNATGSQAISDAKLKEAQSMLSAAQNPQTVMKVLDMMEREMSGRTNSFNDQQAELRQLMEHHSGTPTASAAHRRYGSKAAVLNDYNNKTIDRDTARQILLDNKWATATKQ